MLGRHECIEFIELELELDKVKGRKGRKGRKGNKERKGRKGGPKGLINLQFTD